jgi:hypothetical protein
MRGRFVSVDGIRPFNVADVRVSSPSGGKRDSPKSATESAGMLEFPLDGAQSTLVAPSAHPTHQNPEGIQEVRRILKLQLKSGS